MASNDPPVRIPKLKIRESNEQITPITRLEPSKTPMTSQQAPEPTQAPPQLHAPTPQRPAQATSILTVNNVQPKKKSSLMGFLTIKEPSALAFQQYADEQAKAAARKSPRTTGLQNVPQQKMPDYVPKVNSKWDGMPKVAHQAGNEAWKYSSDQSSLLSRLSKKSSTTTTLRTSQSSTLSGSRGGSYSSGSHSSGSQKSQRSSARTSGGQSNRSSRKHPYNRPNDPFKLSVVTTASQLDAPQQPASSKVPELSTHNLITNDNDRRETTPPEAQGNASTETLKAEPAVNTPITSCSDASKLITSEQPIDISNIHPALRPRPLDLSRQPSNDSLANAPHGPDDIFPESPHYLKGDEPISSVDTSQSQENPQWPLPAISDDLILKNNSSETLPPPIPSRSPARLTQLTTQKQTTPPPSVPQSPSSPPLSPNRAGTASPRNFARPFNTGPLTPPSPQAPTFAIQEPASGSVPGPAFQTSTPPVVKSSLGLLSRQSQHTFSMPLLKPPAFAIGRSITKDSALSPIPESESSSVLSVAIDRDSNVLGENSEAALGVQEINESRPSTATSHHSVTNRSELGSEDDDLYTDTASIRSELSVSWYRSPKERLGLGGLIRHDRSGVPWPLEQEEDLDYVAGSGAMSAEGEMVDRRWKNGKRKTFSFIRR